MSVHDAQTLTGGTDMKHSRVRSVHIWVHFGALVQEPNSQDMGSPGEVDRGCGALREAGDPTGGWWRCVPPT